MCLHFALRYSVLCSSSIVSKASASSCAKACSSSNSPGRPSRSSKIRPREVYLKKRKMARIRSAMPAEPKADNNPIRMPRPVEPPSLIFMTIEVGEPSECDRKGVRGPDRQSGWSTYGEEEKEVDCEDSGEGEDGGGVSKVIASVS